MLTYGKQPDSKPDVFDLSVEEQHKFEMWRDLLPPSNKLITISFTQTGIGSVIVASREDGHKIDITDYSNW